jgi:formamidopyrimidine-DNA glycosylase
MRGSVMPELPEVETVRRSLLRIVGRRVEAVDVCERRLRQLVAVDLPRYLVRKRITDITRRGKYLLFHLDDGNAMLAHLGMSGTLLHVPADTSGGRHDHVRIRLDDASYLTLNDPRRFGLLKVGAPSSFGELAALGPDPLEPRFSYELLAAAVHRRRTPIKNVLMDQHAIGGIGNIYANEILFVAGIRPGRQARRLSGADLRRLYAAMRDVLLRAVAAGGSSISDYRDGNGRPGYFQLRFSVYDRAGLACTRCERPVRRLVHAGRSSFYCPRCQR